jgi:hypothetical protein
MLLRTVLLAISFAIAVPGWAQQPQLPLLELSAGMHRIEAEACRHTRKSPDRNDVAYLDALT